MQSKKLVATFAAAAGLAWGSVHAGPPAQEAPNAPPEVIVFEVAPGTLDGSALTEQEQMQFTMLLMQLMSALQAEGENVEIQLIEVPDGQRT